MGKKKESFISSLFVVGVGNAFVLFASVLVGLVVPKLMGVTNYGYYQIFTLYMTYTALLHGGFIDGVLLLHGGESYDKIDRKQFRLNTKFFTMFQALVSILVVVAAVVFLDGLYRFVFIMVGIDTFVTNITKYYLYISQCTMRFKEWSLRKVIQAVLKIITVLCLVLLQHLGRLDAVSCRMFIAAIVVIDTFLFVWYVCTYRDITFGESLSFMDHRETVLRYFKFGITLTVVYEVSNLILSLDRQFVSVLFDMDTYGIYSFAYRLVAMVTALVSSASTVLFPSLKRKTKEEVIGSFERNMILLSVVVFGALIGYYPLCKFIRFFLSDYAHSLVYFRILLPGVALSSCITVIIYNYYKVLEKTKVYFGICCLVFAFAAGSNYVLYLIIHKPESFSIASIITLFLWYICSQGYLVKQYSLKWMKNLVFIVVSAIAFYICTTVISESLWGTLVYGVFFAIVTICFYGKFFKQYFKGSLS